MAFGGGAMSLVNSCKTHSSETHHKPHERFLPYSKLSLLPDLLLPGKKRHSPYPCRPMLYVRYVHLTKKKPIHNRQPIFSSERMLHKDYDHKGVKLLLLNYWVSSISTSLDLENKTTHSLHGLRHTSQPRKNKRLHYETALPTDTPG
jgi:hypothetical protein